MIDGKDNLLKVCLIQSRQNDGIQISRFKLDTKVLSLEFAGFCRDKKDDYVYANLFSINHSHFKVLYTE